MEQLQMVFLSILNHHINGLIPALGWERVVDLRTTQMQWRFEIAEVVFLQESWMSEATHMTRPIGEGVANVGSTKAVPAKNVREEPLAAVSRNDIPDASIFRPFLSIHLLNLGGPLRHFLLSKLGVLVLPGLKVEIRLALLRPQTMKEDGILQRLLEARQLFKGKVWYIIKVIQAKNKISSIRELVHY